MPLDRERWSIFWRGLLAEGEEEVFDFLEASYGEPHRFYHTDAHIAHCFREFDASRHLVRRPDTVGAAIWFHDVVYNPRANDNEERSALIAEMTFALAGHDDFGREVARYVRSTTSHKGERADSDLQIFLDIDLSILGQSEAVYDAYCEAVRKEYGHYSDQEVAVGRAVILGRFAKRECIFKTPFFRERYEAQARKNIRRELALLQV